MIFCITKLGDKLEQFALSYDNTIEAFKHKDEKILELCGILKDIKK